MKKKKQINKPKFYLSSFPMDTLPSTIIPLLDRLWIPTNDTSLVYATIDQLSIDTKGLNEKVKEAVDANWTRWKTETFNDTDRHVSLFLYNLRFNNVTLKQSLQQWIYPIYDEKEGEETKEGLLENNMTNKMNQLFQKDMLAFLDRPDIDTENVDFSPHPDLMDPSDMRRIVCIPLFRETKKRLYFLHTYNSSFQYTIKRV